MEKKDIKKERPIEPYCFETDKEETWYKVGVYDGYEEAFKEFEREAEFVKEHHRATMDADVIKDIRNIMIDKACRAFCDNICEKSLCGMCFHKYDGQEQIKKGFHYCECNDLKFFRNQMEKEKSKAWCQKVISVNQWHKVEDELPPSEPHLTGWSVMVWATDGTHYEPCKYDSVDRRWVSVYGFNSKMNEVSHWMLLPQLSKEE